MRWAKIAGANIRRARKARGLTQEALAHECGLAMRHIGRIERGEVNVSVETLGKLGELLGLHPSEFLMEENSRSPG